jgi:hypothetical protein
MLFEPNHPRLAQAISRTARDPLPQRQDWDQRRGSSALRLYAAVAIAAVPPSASHKARLKTPARPSNHKHEWVNQ